MTLVAGSSLGSYDIVADSTSASFARVVADGSRVAFDRVETGGTIDIWVADQATGITTRLTFEPARDEFPIWSRDGSRILFRSTRGGGVGDLYAMAADGTGEAQRVLGTDREKWPDDWSPDGRYAIYEETSAEGREELWLLPMTGGGEPSLLVRAPGRSWFGQVSPDGRFIAHQNEASCSWQRPPAPASTSHCDMAIPADCRAPRSCRCARRVLAPFAEWWRA